MPGMDENLLNDVVAAALKAGADAAEAVGAERRGPLDRRAHWASWRRSSARNPATWACGSSSASARPPSPAPTSAPRPAPSWSSAPWPWPGWRRRTPTPASPTRERLARGPLPDLDLYDPTEPAPEALEDQARAAEAAARAVPKVTNSDGGSASWSAVAVADGHQRRLLRPAPRLGLLHRRLGHRRRRRRHGDRLRRPLHPLAVRPADAGRHRRPRPAAAPPRGWARARSPRPPPR